MRVLVTGGAGFIGSHIVDGLLELGVHVAVIDAFTTGKEENINKNAVLYREDISSSALECIFEQERPEIVIHQAAQINVQKSVSDPHYDAESNILGTIRLLEMCRRFGVGKIIYASSAAVYGQPVSIPVTEQHRIDATSPYGLSKYTGEHYVRLYGALHGIRYTVLRYANVYGPRQDPAGEGGVVAIFSHRIAQGLGITIYGDGEQTRDFVHVQDVAQANIDALTRGDGAVINVSSGREVSINQLVASFCRATGRDIQVRYAPERAGEIKRSVLSDGQAQTVLGWQPTIPLSTGLREVLAWESQKRRLA